MLKITLLTSGPCKTVTKVIVERMKAILPQVTIELEMLLELGITNDHCDACKALWLELLDITNKLSYRIHCQKATQRLFVCWQVKDSSTPNLRARIQNIKVEAGLW
ncbi:hypothetical protein SDJN03_01012, partial [Cucurbita argyrosperma subsp. sororia]